MLPLRKCMVQLLYINLHKKSCVKPFRGYCTNGKSNEKSLIQRLAFESVENKTKQNYLDMVTIFIGRDKNRRNHVEFIYAALKNMEQFNVHKDIEVYKALIDVLPKGKFIPTNIFQAEFMHYPKQQQCIVDLLEQMENNGVIPDYEMEAMLLNIFGKRGHPLRKYWRMMYWMPKFKNLSPWPLPNPVPCETLELAKLAVTRMCSVDILSKISVYYSLELKDSIDNTWIVSGISPEQSILLKEHDKSIPLKIEGPFLIWLRDKSVNYFVLKADPNKQTNNDEIIVDEDDVSKLPAPLFEWGITEPRKKRLKSVHEQEDGTIFAITVTGTSTKDSLLSWIRFLQKDGNEILNNIPILFKFRSQTSSELITVNENVKNL